MISEGLKRHEKRVQRPLNLYGASEWQNHVILHLKCATLTSASPYLFKDSDQTLADVTSSITNTHRRRLDPGFGVPKKIYHNLSIQIFRMTFLDLNFQSCHCWNVVFLKCNNTFQTLWGRRRQNSRNTVDILGSFIGLYKVFRKY